jgi:hypothetical protein
LWAEGQTRVLLLVLGTTTVAGLGLMGALLWQVGVVGAAIAVASAFALRSLLLLRAVTRVHELPLPLLLAGAGLGLLVPIAACAAVTLTLRELLEPHRWVGVVAVGAAGLASYLVALSVGGARAEERALLDAVTRGPRLAVSGLYRRARHVLRWVGPVRSTWYLVLELARMAGPDASPTASRFDREFTRRADPWDYDSEPERERYQAALRMLDGVLDGRRFSEAIEIGCAEGAFTELLVPRCERLKAVDISRVALARARSRFGACEAITFEQSDVLNDPQPGTFDLVVAMDLLEYFKRPSDLRRVQAKIHQMLLPDAHLLVTSPKQSEVFERAWWRRWIRRGPTIGEAFAQLPGLRRLESRSTAMHSVTLYVRSDG